MSTDNTKYNYFDWDREQSAVDPSQAGQNTGNTLFGPQQPSPAPYTHSEEKLDKQHLRFNAQQQQKRQMIEDEQKDYKDDLSSRHHQTNRNSPPILTIPSKNDSLIQHTKHAIQQNIDHHNGPTKNTANLHSFLPSPPNDTAIHQVSVSPYARNIDTIAENLRTSHAVEAPIPLFAHRTREQANEFHNSKEGQKLRQQQQDWKEYQHSRGLPSGLLPSLSLASTPSFMTRSDLLLNDSVHPPTFKDHLINRTNLQNETFTDLSEHNVSNTTQREIWRHGVEQANITNTRQTPLRSLLPVENMSPEDRLKYVEYDDALRASIPPVDNSSFFGKLTNVSAEVVNNASNLIMEENKKPLPIPLPPKTIRPAVASSSTVTTTSTTSQQPIYRTTPTTQTTASTRRDYDISRPQKEGIVSSLVSELNHDADLEHDDDGLHNSVLQALVTGSFLQHAVKPASSTTTTRPYRSNEFRQVEEPRQYRRERYPRGILNNFRYFNAIDVVQSNPFVDADEFNLPEHYFLNQMYSSPHSYHRYYINDSRQIGSHYFHTGDIVQCNPFIDGDEFNGPEHYYWHQMYAPPFRHHSHVIDEHPRQPFSERVNHINQEHRFISDHHPSNMNRSLTHHPNDHLHHNLMDGIANTASNTTRHLVETIKDGKRRAQDYIDDTMEAMNDKTAQVTHRVSNVARDVRSTTATPSTVLPGDDVELKEAAQKAQQVASALTKTIQKSTSAALESLDSLNKNVAELMGTPDDENLAINSPKGKPLTLKENVARVVEKYHDDIVENEFIPNAAKGVILAAPQFAESLTEVASSYSDLRSKTLKTAADVTTSTASSLVKAKEQDEQHYVDDI